MLLPIFAINRLCYAEYLCMYILASSVTSLKESYIVRIIMVTEKEVKNAGSLTQNASNIKKKQFM